MEVGDVIISDIDDPSSLSDWTRVNKNIDAATTTTKGIVELATDGENASDVVVQGNDSRLSDNRPGPDYPMRDLSAGWTNTELTVEANSAQWAVDNDTIYDDTALQNASGGWDVTQTTVEANSAAWGAVGYDHTLLETTSGDWDSNYSTTNANSALWSVVGTNNSTKEELTQTAHGLSAGDVV